ncbi:trypsin-like peptidase domain-containing protein [Leptolyngbya sp. 7M]|uniref:VMAP-C domain-containing protein n=1 Tax=Leptolyngbya sp. 7M TaxID=2812896 RepID=UPI001B8D0EE6|nr:trypsin-like peptidase domain-containing protein [Leptolyngbya sp. 7M]QYO62202.1 serine protease [Leptolyngbya sp. 7M]
MFTENQESVYKAGLVRFHPSHQESHKVIGAGFYVGTGYVLTCAHVVTQSLNLGKEPAGIPADAVAGKPIQLDFPFVAKEQFQDAKVLPDLWQLHGQDLAVLKVVEAIPNGVNPLSLPESSSYRDNRYHVYGFPKGHPDGIWARGEFLGEVASGWVQMEDTKPEGLAIVPGFSGAPVWDEGLGGIAGMTVAHDKDREEAKVGFMIPYQKLKPALEAIALFELLLPKAAVPDPSWKNAYRLLRPDISTESYPKTLQEAILQVQTMSAQGSDYRAIVLFIGYLALPELGLLIQPRLLQWLQEQGVDKVEDLLKAVRQKAAIHQAQQPQTLAPHLLFWVQAELNSDRYFVQAYLVKNRDQYDPLKALPLQSPASFLEKSEDEKVNRPEIEQILRQCLDESVEQLAEMNDLAQLRVEVFLPLSCLDWQVDGWFADEQTMFNPKPESIGSRYSLVVRIAERLNPKNCTAQIKALWSGKWSTLTQIQAHPAHHGLVSGDNVTPVQLCDELRRAEIIGFYLTQAPKSFTQDNPGLFPVLIGTGAPVAIWLRQDIPDGCRESFEQFLTRGLADLSTSIRNLRNRAEATCNNGEIHLKQHLSVIWEDPKLVPPGAIQSGAGQSSRLRMPA